MPLAEDGPNAKQIEYWNETAGPRWVEMGDTLDQQISPLGKIAMDRAKITQGERVLDIGCGCGQTTLELANRVGPKGSVLGVDISGPMLGRAQERANEEKATNVAFTHADAQTYSFDQPEFDLIFSRFGVMFFSSPVDAFRNLLSALRPGGRIAFLVWQELRLNPWVVLPITAAAKHLPPAETPPDPYAPGPFALADSKRVADLLRESGFEEISHEAVEQDVLIGGGKSIEDTARFLTQFGPASAALRDAPPELRIKVEKEILQAIKSFDSPDGVRLGSSTWVITATKPQ